MMTVGIDISKDWLDVVIQIDQHHQHQRLAAISANAPALIALEATGPYHVALLEALLAAELPVTLVNPLQFKAFRQTLGGRNKTDRGDAALLARYAALYQDSLPRVQPAEPRQQRLRQLVSYRDGLIKRQTMLTNQLAAARLQGANALISYLAIDLIHGRGQLRTVERDIQAVLATIPEAAVLDAMPGVGWKTVAVVLAYLPIALWGQAKAAAYAGVHPAQHASGTQLTSRMRKQGQPRLRHALYCAAVPCLRWNRELKPVLMGMWAVARSRWLPWVWSCTSCYAG